jgi:hypothetical protein
MANNVDFDALVEKTIPADTTLEDLGNLFAANL